MAQEILISINVESGEAKARVNDLKKGTDSLSKSFGVLAKQSNKNKFEQASLRGEQKLATAQQKKLNYEMQNAGKIAAVYEMSTKKLGKGIQSNRAQSGLSNAILIETGRVASDAAYGIQGIANNLGRLIELGQEFARTNKEGLGGAVKQLKQSFLGLNGVIIGVQLLLSFLPKITKAFQNWLAEVTAVRKALNDATETYGSQIGALETYISFINDSNVSDEQRRVAISRVKSEFEDLNIVIDENTGLTEAQNAVIDEYIINLQRQAESQALLSAIQDKYKSKFLNSTETISENLVTWDALSGAFIGLGSGVGLAAGAISGAAKSIGDDNKDLEKDIDILLAKLKEVGLFAQGSDTSGLLSELPANKSDVEGARNAVETVPRNNNSSSGRHSIPILVLVSSPKVE